MTFKQVLIFNLSIYILLDKPQDPPQSHLLYFPVDLLWVGAARELVLMLRLWV